MEQVIQTIAWVLSPMSVKRISSASFSKKVGKDRLVGFSVEAEIRNGAAPFISSWFSGERLHLRKWSVGFSGE